jgi:hypothetical protein
MNMKAVTMLFIIYLKDCYSDVSFIRPHNTYPGGFRILVYLLHTANRNELIILKSCAQHLHVASRTDTYIGAIINEHITQGTRDWVDVHIIVCSFQCC